MAISRREVLKSLAIGAAATSVLRTIPAQAAEYAHHMVAAEKAAAKVYAPKFFAAHEYKTLQTLCQTIIPADSDSGGAVEAGAPEFIDLLTSENTEYQVKLGGGSCGSTALVPTVMARFISIARRSSKKKSWIRLLIATTQ